MNLFRRASLKKYISVFKISFQQEFAYRFNFIMWRIRNVLQVFLVFFLWDTVFSGSQQVIFGYTRDKILTYVFLTIFVKALVYSARAIDVPGEISSGQILNYLLKPINYFKYWLTRDLSSKALNLSFAILEFGILAFFLKPPLFYQTNFLLIFLFLISLVIAVAIYFFILFIVSTVPFWMPEAAWGSQFLLIIILDFLSGSLFPIDILPIFGQKILYLTPFPYLMFFPIEVYLGNFDLRFIITGLFVGGIWVFLLWVIMKNLWKKGLMTYEAFGR